GIGLFLPSAVRSRSTRTGRCRCTEVVTKVSVRRRLANSANPSRLAGRGNREPVTAMQAKPAFRQQPTFDTSDLPKRKEPSMKRLAVLGIVLDIVPLTVEIDRANAQTADTSPTTSAAASKLSPVDYNFVA